MKAAHLMLLTLLALTVAAKEKVLVIACGDIHPEITLSVLDEQKRPLPGARVTYLGKFDLIRMREVELKRQAGLNATTEAVGTTASTDASGAARLTCVFAFSTSTLDSGKKRTEIIPEGEYVVEAPDYETIRVTARSLFPHSPYPESPQNAAVVLKKRSNQPPEPMRAKGPHGSP